MTTNIALTRLLGKKCKVKLQSGSDFVDTLLAIETEERGTFLIFKNKPVRFHIDEILNITGIEENQEKWKLIKFE